MIYESQILGLTLYNPKNGDYLAETIISNCPSNREMNSLHAFGLVQVKRDIGGIHNLRLQDEVGRWSKNVHFLATFIP